MFRHYFYFLICIIILDALVSPTFDAQGDIFSRLFKDQSIGTNTLNDCIRNLSTHSGLPFETGFFRRLFFLRRKALSEIKQLKQQDDYLLGNVLPTEAKNILHDGIQAKAIVIVVHQYGYLQEKTAEKLKEDPRFSHVPRMILLSELFPLGSRPLFYEASLLYYSEGGQFKTKLNVSEIHFMGGFCEYCLKVATLYALSSAIKSGNNLDFYYYLKEIYSDLPFGSRSSILNWVKQTIEILKWNSRLFEESISDEKMTVTIKGPQNQLIKFHFEYR